MSDSCREEVCCPPPSVVLPADASPCQGATDSVCAQFPAVCLPETRLILKPSNAQVPVLGSVQFKAFLFMDGSEVEITGNVLYTSSNTDSAIIGASSGNVIGISAGGSVITADYGGYQAFSGLEVIEGECADRSNSFLLLFDVSKSSTVGMMGSFPTRLDAAKAFGTSFSDRLNTPKDSAAVMSFDVSTTAVQSFTNDTALIDSKIATLGSTQNQTDLATAITNAVSYFSAQGIVSNRVIVLFTDGEVSAGTDPTIPAQAARDAGIILMIVGLRAKQGAFNLLSEMASPGFFINAIPSNYTEVDDWLNGLKSYICSGDCTPAGGITVGVGQLNFDSFINWNVAANEMDLLGLNPGGIPVYDLLPGNGLYVDDHGSGPGFFGELSTKLSFNLLAGNNYKLSILIAGSQRFDPVSGIRQTRIRFSSELDNTVQRNYTDGFSLEEWTFTPGAPVSGKITINGLELAGTNPSYGNLFKNVVLTNLTTSAVIFSDTFNDDNPTFIDPCEPPPCEPPVFTFVDADPAMACIGDTVEVSWGLTGSAPTAMTVDGVSVTPTLNGYVFVVLSESPHTFNVNAVNDCGSTDGSANVTPIECVLSDWSDWMDTGDWSECVDGIQTKPQARTRTIITEPCPEGTPCGDLTEERTISRSCGDCLPPSDPTFNPGDWTFGLAQVEILCATPGAKIYYNAGDGMSTVCPTNLTGTLYIGPVPLPPFGGFDCVLAVAYSADELCHSGCSRFCDD